MFEDQLVDPVALGAVPGYITAGFVRSLQASFEYNPFVCGFLAMTTPYELDEDLGTLLLNLLFQYTQWSYGNELSRYSVDLDNEEAVLDVALENYKLINKLKGNPEFIIKKWVELQAWRHLERLASPEGGSAERQDKPF